MEKTAQNPEQTVTAVESPIDDYVFPNEPDEVFYNLGSGPDLVPRAPAPPGAAVVEPPPKHYQQETLPSGAKFAWATTTMTEKSVPKEILQSHVAPRGKCGYLIVEKGALQLVWKDTGEVFDVDVAHPLIIEPERRHRLVLTGPVKFKIEFYTVQMVSSWSDETRRPGEAFAPKPKK